jgi:hypothetical protein
LGVVGKYISNPGMKPVHNASGSNPSHAGANKYPPPHPSSYHREDDVQDQIEKYVENLCQIYSKGTGGRADSKIEEKVR